MLIERIDDPSDPRLADYRDLKDPLLRLQRGLFIAESREVIRRLFSCGRFRTRSVLLTPAALEGLRDLLETADSGIRVLLVQHDLVRGVVGYNFPSCPSPKNSNTRSVKRSAGSPAASSSSPRRTPAKPRR